MAAPPQGTSGPSGLAGLRPAFGQPMVCENHAASNLAFTSLQQTTQEQSTSHQLRRLIVRLSTNIFGRRLTNIPGGISNLWKGYNRSTLRYDLSPLEAHA